MNGIIGETTYTTSSVLSKIHPPVIKVMTAKADNGTLTEGLLVAKDSNGDIVAYEPAGDAPLDTCVGVLTQEIDTTKDDAAPVLVHGTAVQNKLVVGAVAPDADDIAALEALGVFAV